MLKRADLLTRLARYPHSCSNPCIRNHDFSNSQMGKYSWQLPSRRFYLSNPFGRLLGILGERKKKLEDQYTRHSKTILSVFEEWIGLFSTNWFTEARRHESGRKSLEDLEKWEPFSWACEHLDDGYRDVWETWFGKEKGKEGYKVLTAQYDEQIRNIKKSIGDKIENALMPYEQFKDDYVTQLIQLIYEYIRSRVDEGHDTYYFGIETMESRMPFISSFRLPKESKTVSYKFGNLTASSESELTKTVDTLNSVLGDTELNDAMKNIKLLGIERNKKQEQFITGVKSIITTATYALKNVEGKCRICRDWKP